jgi:hypothetical protein
MYIEFSQASSKCDWSLSSKQCVQVIDEYDEQSEVADHLCIKVLPLFHFYKDGVLVESFATRDKERIAAIQKCTSPAEPE